MKNVREYFKPTTPEEAVRLFREQPGHGAYIAGGTQVAAVKDPSIEYLVDLTYCGLNAIQEQDGYICIGACATLEDLVQSELIKAFASGILADVARWTGSVQRRNSATIGGGLILRQDLVLPLLALEAELEIVGDGERIIPLTELYTASGLNLQPGELIKTCRVSTAFREASANTRHMTRTRQDVSLISVAAVIHSQGDMCQKARLAVAPVISGVIRVPEAEALLEGQAVTEGTIHTAAATLIQTVQPVDDYCASASYRKKMFGVYTTRALYTCFNIRN
jgi:carbon-monoxide dehydrogenase medium subunit